MILLSLFLSCFTNDLGNDVVEKKTYVEVHKENKACLKKVVSNSVKILNQDGSHGSGTIIRNKNKNYVFTAGHVVYNQTAAIEIYGAYYLSKVVYRDSHSDFLILEVTEEIPKKDPIKFKQDKKIELAEDLFFVGNPSYRESIVSYGSVSGFPLGLEDRYFYIQSYGWFGSSGSVVFNNKCEIMGVVSAVIIEDDPILSVHENAIVIGKIPDGVKEFLKWV